MTDAPSAYSLKKRSLGTFGILNLTPDSFSDSNTHNSQESALNRTSEMLKDQTDVIDIGAESTSPNKTPVSFETEYSRLRTILPELTSAFPDASFSIDTTKHKIAEFAHKNNFKIINDTSFGKNKDLLQFAAESKMTYILTHSLSSPAKKDEYMSQSGYSLIDQICLDSQKTINLFISLGGSASNIIFDPGLGFGKTEDQSIFILSNLRPIKERLENLPILIGHSRKRMVSKIASMLQIDTSSHTLDLVTNVISNYLKNKVDFVRIHNTSIFNSTQVGPVSPDPLNAQVLKIIDSTHHKHAN